MKQKTIKLSQTLQDLVTTALNVNEEKLYIETEDDKLIGSLKKNELLMAFAGGLPSNIPLVKLIENYLKKCKHEVIYSSESHILEKFFNEISLTTEWFFTIFNSIHNGIMIADEACIVRFINLAYTNLTGVHPNEIIGLDLREIRPSARLPEVINTCKPMCGVHRKVGKIEYIVDMHPIFIGGKIKGGITVARDITEIQNLNKKITKYTATVNHLINRVNQQYKAKYLFKDIIGLNKKFMEAKIISKKVSRSDISILIRGESGTGKELFAHAIHNESRRSEGSFVVVNCAAIPTNLLESELFGYEAGAFTGASKNGKLGLLEIANGGTIFLDEIGDMSFDLQAKLLRVLQSGEFQRVGGTELIIVDVRVIAATNRNLEDLIKKEQFREDLYYRLNVAPIKIPSLRERKDDLELLINYFLEKKRKIENKSFSLSEDTMQALKNYSWPGNVRELENTLNFLTSIANDRLVSISNLPEYFLKQKRQCEQFNKYNDEKIKTPDYNNEKEAIIEALKQYGKTVKGKKEVAKKLGISLATLYNRIKLYGIK